MKKHYICRGQHVDVEQLPVLAVRPLAGPQVAQSAAGAVTAQGISPLPQTLPAGLSAAEVEPFGRSGWHFRPAESPPAGVQAQEVAPPQYQTATVLRHASGQISLATDLMVVQLRPDLPTSDVPAILEALNLEVVHTLRFADRMFEVRVPPGTDPVDRSRELSADPRFVFAEPELLEQIGEHRASGDPEYARQWHLKNTGQDGGKPGADLGAESAWQTSTGRGVIIAIVDNGFDPSHPDLAGAVDPRSGQFQETVPGRFELRQGFASNVAASLVKHGTFCAGMAGARANNGIAGRGVAYDAQLMLVACLLDQINSQATLARALAYAADPAQENGKGAGADVISCSLGRQMPGWKMMSVLKNAIDFAVGKGRAGLGTAIFWAVDNAYAPLELNEVCSDANVIAVGPSDNQDQYANTAYGSKLEFLAPGIGVYGIVPGGGFDSGTGSSFAAPCAAAVAALVLDCRPKLAWQDVRQVLRDSCVPVTGAEAGFGGSRRYGRGRISAALAVQKASSKAA